MLELYWDLCVIFFDPMLLKCIFGVIEEEFNGGELLFCLRLMGSC